MAAGGDVVPHAYGPTGAPETTGGHPQMGAYPAGQTGPTVAGKPPRQPMARQRRSLTFALSGAAAAALLVVVGAVVVQTNNKPTTTVLNVDNATTSTPPASQTLTPDTFSPVPTPDLDEPTPTKTKKKKKKKDEDAREPETVYVPTTRPTPKPTPTPTKTKKKQDNMIEPDIVNPSLQPTGDSRTLLRKRR